MDTKELIDWFDQNQRDLPWRHTKEPYKIWLSEIILQQTQVAQGLPYYKKFISKYPDIYSLAEALEQEVLNLWQGLGYYSRARNLHYTARDIVKNYDGVFPKTYKDLLKLKGIGDYTAAAIASFCYDEPVPVLDGNVFRVLSRIFGEQTPINTTTGKKVFKKLAQQNLDVRQPAIYNQAIMEFGAIHCTPALPKCNTCPFINACVAYQTGRINSLPVKKGKIKFRKRYLNYFLITHRNQLVLEKREGKGIWQNLYQLPLIETKDSDIPDKKQITKFLNDYNVLQEAQPVIINQVIHKLTHQHLHINFWKVKSLTKPKRTIVINLIKNYPMPIVIAKFLDNINL